MFFVSYLVALAAALPTKDEPKPLKLSLNKNIGKEAATVDSRFRSGPGPQRGELWVDGYYYMIDIDIGDKGQTYSVELDTGSADLWMDKLKLKNLSSWKNMSEPYSIWYYDHTLIQGSFGTSLVWLDSGVEVKDYQWVVADNIGLNPNNFDGMFGVGRVENESVAKEKRYPNFVQRLKDDGKIKTNGYLYYLNAKDATSGSVVFGGIDKAKIKGKVAKMPLNLGTPDSRFDNINLTKITGVNGEVLGENIEVNLDTGVTISRLPLSIIKQIQQVVPTTARKSDGVLFVPCQMDRNLYILLWFNDVEVRLTLDDLAIKARYDDGLLSGKCILGVLPTTEGSPNSLGVSSLTHAYVTIDHDNNFAYISNVNYTDDEDLVLL